MAKGYPIRRCGTCGLGRADASSFDPTAYYTKGYFDGSHDDGYADYVGSEAVLRRQFAGEVAFLRRYVPAGRLLEIGCAYGFFLQEAKQHFDVTGIELSDEAAQYGRDHGLNVISGVADAKTLDAIAPVDAVAMLDVIEHLPDPRETVGLLAAKLKPGGAMMVTTGDFGSLFARLCGSGWRLMTPPQHLWFFTPASIGAIARSCGLEVVRVDHPWKTVPLSLIVYQLTRMLGLKPRAITSGSSAGIPVNLFDAMRVVLRKPLERTP